MLQWGKGLLHVINQERIPLVPEAPYYWGMLWNGSPDVSGELQTVYKGDQDGMVGYREDCEVHQLYNGIYPLSNLIPIFFSGGKPTAREPSTFMVLSQHVVQVHQAKAFQTFIFYYKRLVENPLKVERDVPYKLFSSSLSVFLY